MCKDRKDTEVHLSALQITSCAQNLTLSFVRYTLNTFVSGPCLIASARAWLISTQSTQNLPKRNTVKIGPFVAILVGGLC